MSHVLGLSLKAHPTNVFDYLGKIDRSLTLKHAQVMYPKDNIFCGMSEYCLNKCTFSATATCIKEHMIAPMAEYVAQYCKSKEAFKNQTLYANELKVRLFEQDIHMDNSVKTVEDIKDRIVQRGSN